MGHSRRLLPRPRHSLRRPHPYLEGRPPHGTSRFRRWPMRTAVFSRLASVSARPSHGTRRIEESPSPALTLDTREAMEAAAEARGEDDRLPQRRDVRVPARRRPELLLHRVERAPAGRTSRLGARDRDRSRTRAAANRCGRAAGRDRPRTPPGPRDRDQDQRRGSWTRLRAGARPDHGVPATSRARRPARHVCRGRLHGNAVLQIPTGQDRHLGRRPSRRDLARASRTRGARGGRDPTRASFESRSCGASSSPAVATRRRSWRSRESHSCRWRAE